MMPSVPELAIFPLTPPRKKENSVVVDCDSFLMRLDSSPLPMNDTTILLIAKDERLAASVRGTLESLADVQLRTVPSFSVARSMHGAMDVALVLVHLASREDTDAAAALLRNLADLRQAVPTLLL